MSNPGLSSRVAHHIDFPDYDVDELMEIAHLMLEQQNYVLGEGADEAFREYLDRRVAAPALRPRAQRRNSIDRARLRQANRLFAEGVGVLSREELVDDHPEDILQSSVFGRKIASPRTLPPGPRRTLKERQHGSVQSFSALLATPRPGRPPSRVGSCASSARTTSPTSAPTTTTATTARQRAERNITPLDPDCNYMDIIAQDIAHLRNAEPSSSRSTTIPRRYVRPAGVHRARAASRSSRACWATTPRPAPTVRRACLPRPARGAAPALEGPARLLTPRLHDRPGAGRARPPRARLRGLIRPQRTLRRHRRLLPARRRRGPGAARRRADAARHAAPPRPSARCSTARPMRGRDPHRRARARDASEHPRRI